LFTPGAGEDNSQTEVGQRINQGSPTLLRPAFGSGTGSWMNDGEGGVDTLSDEPCPHTALCCSVDRPNDWMIIRGGMGLRGIIPQEAQKRADELDVACSDVLAPQGHRVGKKGTQSRMIGSNTDRNPSEIPKPCSPPVVVTKDDQRKWGVSTEPSSLMDEQSIWLGEVGRWSPRETRKHHWQNTVDHTRDCEQLCCPGASKQRCRESRCDLAYQAQGRQGQDCISKVVWPNQYHFAPYTGCADRHGNCLPDPTNGGAC
jgi:hypothetical protein